MAETLISVYGGMFDSTEVVEVVGGFPRGNKAVDSEFFARMISCFWSDGVFGNDSFKVTPRSGMQIGVDPGIAWIGGRMAWQKSTETFAISAGVKYTLALRLNLASGEFSLVLSDASPFTAQRGETVRDLVLAIVETAAGATEVTTRDITDCRLDPALCGIVTSTVDSLGAVEVAQNSNNLGGSPASEYLMKAGGVMRGELTAAADSTGKCVVRNIGYGETLPETLSPGELFVLVTQE